MNTELNEQELLRQLKALPAEIRPANDVWPDILSRIDGAGVQSTEKNSAGRWRSLAIAAGILVAFATGLLLGPKWLAPPAVGVNEQEWVSNESPGLRVSPSLSATLAATEMEYQAAFREFMAVGDTTNSLEPITVEKLMMSWDEMKQSEAGLTAALRENPNNPFLNTRMMELRSRQLDFLKQIAALDHNSKRTTI